MISIFVSLLILIPAPPDRICPEPSNRATQVVQSLLQNGGHFRTTIGASEAEYQSVEPLTDESTCDFIQLSADAQGLGLDHLDPRYRYVYVRSQNYFYLVTIYTPLPEDDFLYLGLTPLWVMNRSYQVIHGIMR